MNFHKDSAVAGNGYTFACPTVGRDARYLVCSFKRDKAWKGQSLAEADCRCAMRGGKCPAIAMLKKEWNTGNKEFYDSGTTVHRLPADIIEHMDRIRLLPSHAAGLELSSEQKERLFGDSAVTIPTMTLVPDTSPAKFSRPKKDKPVDHADMLTGVVTEMSSLINASME